MSKKSEKHSAAKATTVSGTDYELVRTFIEDSTFQARSLPPVTDAAKSPLSLRVRQLYGERNYAEVVRMFGEHPGEFPVCTHAAMALRALGKLRESIVPATLALAYASDDHDRQSALLLVGTRVYHLYGDGELAEHLFRAAWNLWPRGERGGWQAIVNISELLITRARKAGGEDMAEALKQVDELFGALLSNFAGWESDANFVAYLQRQIDLQEYRDSAYWRRFEHTQVG